MLGKSLVVVYYDAAVTAYAVGGGSARTHRHEIDRQVMGAYAVYVYQPEHMFEIGGDTKIRVERPETLIAFFPAVERRMSRLVAHKHCPAREEPRRIIAHALAEIRIIDKMDVAEYGVDIFLTDSPGYGCKNFRRRIKVIRVQDSDHIARGQGDTFVHSVIKTLVRFADPLEPSLVFRLKFADDFQSVVSRIAVNYDMFPIRIILRQNASHSVAKGRTTVVSNRDNRYFH